MLSIEKWEANDEHGKGRRAQYGLSPERFRLACDLYGVEWGELDRRCLWVPVRNARHAFDLVGTVAKAANSAPQRISLSVSADPGTGWNRRV